MEVFLDENDLEKPPQVICRDPSAIKKYFDYVERFGEIHSKRLRVWVVGNTGAGKTSLINGLLTGESRLTEKGENTEGIMIRNWYPDPANQALELDVWDFGGQYEYQSVHHYFIEKRSLFLLVVDLSTYELSQESYSTHVGKWIDSLKCMVRRPVIMMTAAKADCLYEYNSDGIQRNSRDGDKLIEQRCKHMIEKIKEQEDLDIKLLKQDIRKLEQNSVNESKTKLDSLKLKLENRPLLPRSIIYASLPAKETCPPRTCIAVASAGRPHIMTSKEWNLDFSNVGSEVCRAAGDASLFPFLEISLPSIWIQIEQSLTSLSKEIVRKNGPQYITLKKLDEWLLSQIRDYGGDPDRLITLESVLAYLVGLGKILQFKEIEQLKNLVFIDPQWFILLVKDVIHHDLQTHLEYKEEFKVYNMDMTNFEDEKDLLTKEILLSRSLLKCIWHDKIPEDSDFDNLFPLLHYFDVGYEMTEKEAEFEEKQYSKSYTLIPALMSDKPNRDVEETWSTPPSEDQLEIISKYAFCSRIIPPGLFERLMVRCHKNSDYMLHWKTGFLGVHNLKDKKKRVDFHVTRSEEKEENAKVDIITIASRAKKVVQLKDFWRTVIRLHLTFFHLKKEFWPELRYNIYNNCPSCRKCHREMDLERLVKVPNCYSESFCKKSTFPPEAVNNELVYPSPGQLFFSRDLLL